MAKEFGYKIDGFHHAVEAYKIADLLSANGICAAMWADWWGFKMEAYDGDQREYRAGRTTPAPARSSIRTTPTASSG